MRDLIDRQAVREFIKSYRHSTDVAFHMEEHLDEIPAASPWHRVEEPPKDEGKYLVYDGRGNYYVVWWGQRLGWCYDPKFFCYWMPIEPPKEETYDTCARPD